MTPFKEQFIVDADGNRVAVVLAIADYERLLDELEELDDSRAYVAAKSDASDFLPLEEALAEVERERRELLG